MHCLPTPGHYRSRTRRHNRGKPASTTYSDASIKHPSLLLSSLLSLLPSFIPSSFLCPFLPSFWHPKWRWGVWVTKSTSITRATKSTAQYNQLLPPSPPLTPPNPHQSTNSTTYHYPQPPSKATITPNYHQLTPMKSGQTTIINNPLPTLQPTTKPKKLVNNNNKNQLLE